MTLKTPYCTIAEADIYLANNADWLALNDATKNDHLVNGRYFLDAKYFCVEFDETNPPEEIKKANALLAEDSFEGILINSAGSINGKIKRKRVKAGSVESETEYIGASITSAQEDVTLLLSDLCTKKGGSFRLVNRV